MVINILENIVMENHVVEANIFGVMELFMKVNLKKERSMDMVFGKRE